jgi:hypothetical protein
MAKTLVIVDHAWDVARFSSILVWFKSRVLTWLRTLPQLVREWAKRSTARRELLTYFAQDHRAAGDLGFSNAAEARAWAERPFWKA